MSPAPARRRRALLGLCGALAVVLLTGGAAALQHPQASARPRVEAVPLPIAGPVVPDDVRPDLLPPPGGSVEVLRPGRDGVPHLFLHGAALPPSVDPGAPLVEDVVWVQNSRLRSYRIVVPRGLPRSAPLVVALPGYKQGLGLAQAQQRWADQAARGRFVAVYAGGYAGSWDAGLCCGSAAQARTDDVGYLDALLVRVRATHAIDPRRVFLAGFSNGGMMAYRYACERSDTVAAVFSVAGPIETRTCRPTAPVAVLHVHGRRDLTVPLGGVAYDHALGARLRSAADTVRFWQRADGDPRLARLVVRSRLGHDWPRDGAGLAWAFFAAHPRP